MRRWSYKTFFSSFFFLPMMTEMMKCVCQKRRWERKEKLFWCPNNDQSRDLCRWRKADVIDQLVVVVRSFNLPINTNGFESPHYFRGDSFSISPEGKFISQLLTFWFDFFQKKKKKKKEKVPIVLGRLPSWIPSFYAICRRRCWSNGRRPSWTMGR